jgi:hypothetical protein
MRGSNEEYGFSELRTHIKMIVICWDPEQGVKIPVKPDLFEKYREWYKVVTLKYDEERKVAKENPDLTDKLFPTYFTSGLSQVVTQMSKKLGINSKGGTNYLRHSKITIMLSNSKISPEERIKLATSMGHSVNIQSEYERLITV